MRSAFIVPVLLLAACEQALVDPAEETAPAIVTDEASDDEPQGVTTLAGSWRVAELDGDRFENFMPLMLFGNVRVIYWDPACAGWERRYVIDGREFSATPPPSEGPRIACDIGLPERIEDVFAAIDEADRIQPADGGGVLLSGLRRSILLMPI
ncbi:hypothetical protein [Altererythrobacter sp. MF3-039]|uniref:hypothetical protein n=1 Tax=Altererythrobacter sp. MF3-039 TaxID=3252901 RepID=UPI00390C59CC